MPNEQQTFAAMLGERMRRKRWHYSWNVNDVLPRLETPVDESTYVTWENGTLDIPINRLPDIARALNFKDVKHLMPYEFTGEGT